MKLLIRFLMILGLLFIKSVAAVEVKDLFEVQVMAKSLNDKDKSTALRQAMEVVVNRLVSGDKLKDNPTIQAAIYNADIYVEQSQYSLASKTHRRTLERVFRVKFKEKEMMTMVKESQLAIWNEMREEVLVWLVVDNFSAKRLLNRQDNEKLYQAVQKSAKQKGVPILWPLMDLEDEQKLSAEDVLSASSIKLVEASKRYDVSAILSGTLRQRGRCWNIEWSLHFNGKIHQDSLVCAELDKNMGLAMQGVYEQLSAFHAIQPEKKAKTMYKLTVSGIVGRESEENTLGYLTQLPNVESVKLLKREQGRHVFGIMLQGKPQLLEKSISLDGLLDKVQKGTQNGLLNYKLKP